MRIIQFCLVVKKLFDTTTQLSKRIKSYTLKKNEHDEHRNYGLYPPQPQWRGCCQMGLRATKRSSETFELIDLKDYDLPLLDEPIPASQGKYSKKHTQKWAAKIDSFDAFVFVTPEYNHSMPGALKNALDFLYAEWNNKAAGFVSYGSAGGSRAVEHLRLVMAELMIADVHAQVLFSLETDFVNYTEFKPDPKHEQKTNTLLDEVAAWGIALKGLRTQQTQGSVTRGILNEYSDVKKMFYKSD